MAVVTNKSLLSMSDLHNFSIKHGLGSQDGIPMPSNDFSVISKIPKLDQLQQSNLNIDPSSLKFNSDKSYNNERYAAHFNRLRSFHAHVTCFPGLDLLEGGMLWGWWDVKGLNIQ